MVRADVDSLSRSDSLSLSRAPSVFRLDFKLLLLTVPEAPRRTAKNKIAESIRLTPCLASTARLRPRFLRPLPSSRIGLAIAR